MPRRRLRRRRAARPHRRSRGSCRCGCATFAEQRPPASCATVAYQCATATPNGGDGGVRRLLLNNDYERVVTRVLEFLANAWRHSRHV